MSDSKKIKAIKSLLKHGYRGDEWQEAGLLWAVEEVVNDECKDLSSSTLKKLMEEAKTRY